MEYNSKYLQICGVLGIDVTYAHDNRELSDYVVQNNQKRLIFANITEKWYTWRVFTGAVGIKKGQQVPLLPRTDSHYAKTANHLPLVPNRLRVRVLDSLQPYERSQLAFRRLLPAPMALFLSASMPVPGCSTCHCIPLR